MKKVLDRYISNNYDEIRKYTEYILIKMNDQTSADVIINNSYLHCVEIVDDKADQDKVKSYLFNTIKKQILWATSVSHLQEKVSANEFDIPNDFDDEQDLNDKILEEKIYHDNKSCIEIYRNNVPNRIKAIIFEAYFDKGYTTARSMANYFDIPVTSAHYFIRDIKVELKKIKDENKR